MKVVWKCYDHVWIQTCFLRARGLLCGLTVVLMFRRLRVYFRHCCVKTIWLSFVCNAKILGQKKWRLHFLWIPNSLWTAQTLTNLDFIVNGKGMVLDSQRIYTLTMVWEIKLENGNKAKEISKKECLVRKKTGKEEWWIFCSAKKERMPTTNLKSRWYHHGRCNSKKA